MTALALLITATTSGFAQSLTTNEAKGTTLSNNWRVQRGLVTTGADGKVIFLFGETQPSVVCSPLQVCDIELQGGEIVRDVLVGDTVRWKIEPATSGAAGGQAIHLIVKPSEAGLVTSMVVTTYLVTPLDTKPLALISSKPIRFSLAIASSAARLMWTSAL